MIHVIDKASTGKTHLMYNISVIRLLHEAFPDERIRFYSEAEHRSMVEAKLSGIGNLEYKSIKIVSSSTSNPIKKITQLLQKVREDKSFFTGLLRQMNKSDGDWVFICTVSTISLPYWISAAKKFPHVRVVATVHGELEHLYYSETMRERRIGKVYKKIFSNPSANIAYLLLNKISKNYLVKDKYLESEHIIEMDHPYDFDSGDFFSELAVNKPLKVGHVGSLGVRKNAQLLYLLAENMKELIDLDKVQIYSIGALEDNILKFRNDLVIDGYESVKDNKQYLGRDVFESKLKALNYALFFYTPTQFIFRASGAILDVIAYQKPVIVLRHPFFEYLFSKAGNIGYLCDTLDEMKVLLEKITLNREAYQEEYQLQVNNLCAYKNEITIQKIAEDFKQQFAQFSNNL